MIKKLRKAFTITELVIVIAVIAILAAVLIPTFTHVVNNAKVSSAMQTCRNALTDYLALVGGDDDPDNDDATGMVFVSDGYAFVYLNSALQQIGEVDKLAVIQNGTTDLTSMKETDGITFEDSITAENGKVTIAFNYSKEDVEEKAPIEIKMSDLAATEDKTAENLYFYAITVNKTLYSGYFTYEPGESPKLQLQGATYSRTCGFISSTYGTLVVTGA